MSEDEKGEAAAYVVTAALLGAALFGIVGAVVLALGVAALARYRLLPPVPS